MELSYDITLGICVGRGSLGLPYMLFGYLLKKDTFRISSRKARLRLLVAATLLLWLVSALKLLLTNELFLVTAGFFPIAFFAFALSNAAMLLVGQVEHVTEQWHAEFTQFVHSLAQHPLEGHVLGRDPDHAIAHLAEHRGIVRHR